MSALNRPCSTVEKPFSTPDKVLSGLKKPPPARTRYCPGRKSLSPSWSKAAPSRSEFTPERSKVRPAARFPPRASPHSPLHRPCLRPALYQRPPAARELPPRRPSPCGARTGPSPLRGCYSRAQALAWARTCPRSSSFARPRLASRATQPVPMARSGASQTWALLSGSLVTR